MGLKAMGGVGGWVGIGVVGWGLGSGPRWDWVQGMWASNSTVPSLLGLFLLPDWDRPGDPSQQVPTLYPSGTGTRPGAIM